MTETAQKRPRKERKENADKRRRELLDAARRSLLKHGLARTTLATVADEAGLSQGVAVFYFKSKGGLLTETLRDLYLGYETHWQAALAAAGPDPKRRLEAVLAADFDPAACGPDVLPLWFAFWGELRFQAQYDEVAADFEARRRSTLCEIWRAVLPDRPAREADGLAEWMDILTDGYWQRLHLSPTSLDLTSAHSSARACLVQLVPEAFQA